MDKDKDIIEIIVDEPCEKKNFAVLLKNKITDYVLSLENDVSPLFIKISLIAALLIILAAPFVGILIPKTDGAVTRRLASYHVRDVGYLTANGAFTAVSDEIKRLETRLESTQKELDKFNQSRDSLDKITEKTDELTAKKSSLQDEIKTKQSLLASLTDSQNTYTGATITCPSGRYTVGENIPEGKYLITGTGSIVISNSGSARVNKSLKSDGESFTLNNGDIIKIDGNAKLIPE